MRKLNVLINFMKTLLIMTLFKSVSQIIEAIFLWTQPRLVHDDWSNLILTSCCEFVNWVFTQLIILLVAMRFYESAMPIKRLEISMRE